MKNSKTFLLVRGTAALIFATLAYILPEPILPMHMDVYRLVRVVVLFTGIFIFLEKLVKMEIYTKILIGLFFGAVAGIFFKGNIVEIKPVGTAFIRSIQMIVIPLVFASLLVGTASLGDPKKLGRVGAKTLAYYLIYTAFAIFIGLFLANLLKPGSGLDPEIQTKLL